MVIWCAQHFWHIKDDKVICGMCRKEEIFSNLSEYQQAIAKATTQELEELSKRFLEEYKKRSILTNQ